MTQISQWPLSGNAIRYPTPAFILRHLDENPLTRGCYPTAMGYYPTALGHRMQRESHNDNLIIFCADGHGELRTRDFSGSVEPGTLVVLPAGFSHEYWSSDSEPWTIYWLHFTGLGAELLLEGIAFEAQRPLVQLGPQPQLINDFHRLFSLRESGFQRDVYVYAASIVRQIMCFIAVEARNSNAFSRHNFDLGKIQQLMRDHVESSLELDTLAECAQLSRYHFSSKYKRLTGYSPIQHFLHMKMEFACELLDSSSLPIQEIAHRLGYDDALYFSRSFRKIMGVAPSTYRIERGKNLV